jgi:HEAT repeat protein
VLATLTEMIKAGLISELKIINIAIAADQAQAAGIRSVPSLRLGPYQLDGVRSRAELEHYARLGDSDAGFAKYFSELLASGALPKVIATIREDESRLDALLQLLWDKDTPLAARVGVGAVMEEFAGTPALRALVQPLGELTQHADAHVRTDACHYLALTGAREAIPWIEKLLNDANGETREVARESLDQLSRLV